MALQIGQETPPPDESADIEQLNALHLMVHQVQPGPKRRGEHPKTHAGVWADFQVAADLPDEFRIGLFESPRSFQALIRFSNGRTDDDRQPDVHGIAIKVLMPQPDGKDPLQQDFILADHPIFFAQNVKHLLQFLQKTSSGTPASELAVTTHPKLIGYTSVPRTGLLQMTYWSQVPYQFGAGAVKYVVSPSAEQSPSSVALTDSPDCLRAALVEQLTVNKCGMSFNLCVQPQRDPVTMPIEDPTVEWTSTPVRVATIKIDPQAFDSAAQMTFVENTSWSPWNALPEHRPLGGISRARQLVYADSCKMRYQANNVKPLPVTGRESF